jgi:hypothetical protein
LTTLASRLSRWLRPVVYLGTNPVTLLGAALTTSAGLTLVALWIYETGGGRPPNPYAGMFLYLVLPALFTLGLVLMPAGAL